MGIDIYAEWDGMTEAEHDAQLTGFSVEHGHVGYLREAYHGEPYTTKVLVPGAFEEHRVPIHAATLADRLPAVSGASAWSTRQVPGKRSSSTTSSSRNSPTGHITFRLRPRRSMTRSPSAE